MKFIVGLFAALVATTTAFAPISMSSRPQLTKTFMVDTAKAIEEAMAASKEFGASSPEARAAWDIVEEMDASNR